MDTTETVEYVHTLIDAEVKRIAKSKAASIRMTLADYISEAVRVYSETIDERGKEQEKQE